MVKKYIKKSYPPSCDRHDANVNKLPDGELIVLFVSAAARIYTVSGARRMS